MIPQDLIGGAFAAAQQLDARVRAAHRRRDPVALAAALRDAEFLDASAHLVALATWFRRVGLARVGGTLAAIGFAVGAGRPEGDDHVC